MNIEQCRALALVTCIECNGSNTPLINCDHDHPPPPHPFSPLPSLSKRILVSLLSVNVNRQVLFKANNSKLRLHRTRLLESIISVPAQPSPPMLAVLPVQVRVSVSVAVSEKLETFAADYKLSHPGFGLEDRRNSKFKMFWSKF